MPGRLPKSPAVCWSSAVFSTRRQFLYSAIFGSLNAICSGAAFRTMKIGASAGSIPNLPASDSTAELPPRTVAPLLDNEFVKAVRDRFGVEFPDYLDSSDTRSSELVPTDADADPETDPARVRMGKVEVLTRSLDIMSEALARYQTASHPLDLLIRIPRKAARTLEFHKAAELIAIGRSLTAAALDQLPERV